MSYSLYLVKPAKEIPKAELEKAFDQLNRGEPEPAFLPLPIEEILDALREQFQDYDPPACVLLEDPEGHGGAETFYGTHYLFLAATMMPVEILDRLHPVLAPFGLHLYDPQAVTLTPFITSASESSSGEQQILEIPKVDMARAEALWHEVAESGRANADARERKNRAERPEWYAAIDQLTEQIQTQCAGGAWQRLGVHETMCAKRLHGTMIGLNEWGQDPSNGESEADFIVWYLHLGHLQAIPNEHPLRDTAVYGRRGITFALNYLDGDWRVGHKLSWLEQALTRETARKELRWIDSFRAGLLLALLYNDEESIARFWAWAGEDLMDDCGLDDRATTADNKAYIALCYAMRGEPLSRIEPLRDEILRRKKKRAIAFWTACESILKHDAETFGKSLREICQLHNRIAFPADPTKGFENDPFFAKFQKKIQVPTWEKPLPEINIAGSILWHVARRANLELPKLSQSARDFMLGPAL